MTLEPRPGSWSWEGATAGPGGEMGHDGGEGWKWVRSGCDYIPPPLETCGSCLWEPIPLFPLPYYLPGRATLGSEGLQGHRAVLRELFWCFSQWGMCCIAASWGLCPSSGLVFLQREQRCWDGCVVRADPAGCWPWAGSLLLVAGVIAVPSPAFVMLGLPLALGKSPCPCSQNDCRAAEALRAWDLTHPQCRGTVRNSWYGVTGAVVWCCSSSASSAWALRSPRITYRPSGCWSRTKCRQRSLPLAGEGMGWE